MQPAAKHTHVHDAEIEIELGPAPPREVRYNIALP